MSILCLIWLELKFLLLGFKVSGREVVSIIRSFKSKQCPIHVIPNLVYKHCSEIISPVLAKLIAKLFCCFWNFPWFVKKGKSNPNIQSVPKKCTPFLKAYISYEYAYISNLFVAYCWKFCSLFFLKISLFFTEKWTPHNKLNERGWKTLVYKSINFYLIIFLRLFGE